MNSLFDMREFKGIPVSNQICQQCGLVFQSPRMTEAEQLAFYEQGYRSLYQGQENPQPQDLAIQAARARLVMNFLGEFTRPSSPVLDIGCSSGILLKQFKESYQVQTCGVEPGRMFREYARLAGLEVYPSLDELQLARPGRFNLVSMMHVLEHLPDPLAYLKHVRERLLEPQGWLLLEVPNLYAHDCFEVAHLFSYSTHSLSQLVAVAGFKVVKLHAQGLPRSRLIPLYLTLLARPASAETQATPFRKEAGIKLKRQFGLFRRRLTEKLLPRYAWLKI